MIKVYSMNKCKYCEEAKKWLKEKNIDFVEINLSAKENSEHRKYYRSLGVNVAPIITGFNHSDGEWIVCGFNEEKRKQLEELLKNAESDKKN